MRREDDRQREMSHAYAVALLCRQEKLPELSEWLRVPGRRQTLEEQRTVVRMLSEKFGIPLRQKVH